MAKTQLTARATKMHGVIEKYLTSSLTQKAFYKQENIPGTTFIYWLRHYREYKRSAQANTKKAEGFIPLIIKQNGKPAQTGCRLDYGNGVSLSFETIPPARLLLQLIRGL